MTNVLLPGKPIDSTILYLSAQYIPFDNGAYVQVGVDRIVASDHWKVLPVTCV